MKIVRHKEQYALYLDNEELRSIADAMGALVTSKQITAHMYETMGQKKELAKEIAKDVEMLANMMSVLDIKDSNG